MIGFIMLIVFAYAIYLITTTVGQINDRVDLIDRGGFIDDVFYHHMYDPMFVVHMIWYKITLRSTDDLIDQRTFEALLSAEVTLIEIERIMEDIERG